VPDFAVLQAGFDGPALIALDGRAAGWMSLPDADGCEIPGEAIDGAACDGVGAPLGGAGDGVPV
jgi:hypothetical protein